MGWIATYGSGESMRPQVNFMTEGGAGAPVPDMIAYYIRRSLAGFRQPGRGIEEIDNAIRTYGLDVGAGQAWVDHMLAHPAMIEWERQALAESWREESHEAELTAAGLITADYRTA